MKSWASIVVGNSGYQRSVFLQELFPSHQLKILNT
ncbi:hypothetical protein SLEP1_g49209 [Rubroshorea leprosula]|uniref:Uncharacterized protein n=1 Tax=Rubroshorea leprosula TaxID=152421 RepID=A0AAV5LYJ8_9ROSI|nr:hypothetical protein SLEP1_g49209 [Rubroshorea leprosula]